MRAVDNMKMMAGTMALAALVISSCTNSAPSDQCLLGAYALSKDKTVRLQLAEGYKFDIYLNNKHISGEFKYSNDNDLGQMPGSGKISFYPSSFPTEDKSTHGELRNYGEDFSIFLRSIKDITGSEWPVYRGGDGRIHIALNSDLDHSDLEFDGPMCSDNN